MGREAYLNRVLLGRSAFEAPLRDESGTFTVGPNVHDHGDRGYEQQWNDRGRPHNPESERRSRKLRQAQNEVLHACGVIVSKNVAKTEKLKQLEVPRATRLAQIEEGNNIGFFAKGVDRVVGIISTWWLKTLRTRVLVSGCSFPSFAQMIRSGYRTSPADFFYAGFPAELTAGFARIVRQCETEETGIEPINFLEVRWGEPPFSEEKLRLWGAWILFMSVEIPFEFASVLQSLGVSVLPAIVDCLHSWLLSESSPRFDLLRRPASVALLQTISLYLLRDWTYFQLKRRIYQLIGQLTIRPTKPAQICIEAADTDDMIDATSILGLGRGLGTYTNRRFFGPLSFWNAIPIAFPLLSQLIPSPLDREAIKKETLARCLLSEDADESRLLTHSLRSQIRARNILNNLESLGVDVEEDFFVDMDSWTMELDSISFTDMLHQQEEMSPIENMTDRPIPSIESDDQRNADGTEAHPEGSTREILEPTVVLEEVINHAQTEGQDISTSADRPPTPEQILRRATSLTPFAVAPSRRATEIIEAEMDDGLALMLAEVNRQRVSQTKQKPKDSREFNITRLSVFTADSFAWHASSIIASFAVLPFDALFVRSLVSWYTITTYSPERLLGISSQPAVFGLRSLTSNPWHTLRAVLLSFGIECLVRGVFWQWNSVWALRYDRSITTHFNSSEDSIEI